MEQKIKL